MSDKNIIKSATLLSTVLSDEMTLYIKTRKFDWNVSGEKISMLHDLFESQYKQLEEAISEIAKRIGGLGEHTFGTMHEFLKYSSIRESPGKYATAKDMLKELLVDHQSMINRLRKGIDDLVVKHEDIDSAELLNRLLEQHETSVWVLKTYIN